MVKSFLRIESDFMNKRGFTLIELIAVIVVLAAIIALVAPSLMNASGAAKEKTFQTKTVFIEKQAVIYGQDHYRTIVNGANKNLSGYGKETIEGTVHYTYTLKVGDLVPDYVEKDNDDGPFYVTDPRESGKYLDEETVTIKINSSTRKVTAKYNGK